MEPRLPLKAGTVRSVDSVNQDGTIGTTRTYCDDDFTDSDGDGLANWEELLGTYGWFSNPTLADTDGDGVSDFDEVFDNTDPTEPCFNTLDPDGDGINSTLRIQPVAILRSLGFQTVRPTIWVTDCNRSLDNGGVDDGTECFGNYVTTILLTISYLMISTTMVFQMLSIYWLIGAIPIRWWRMLDGAECPRHSGSSTAWRSIQSFRPNR